MDRKVKLWLLLAVVVLFAAAPIVARYAFHTDTDADGNSRTRSLGADFMEPPKFAGVPNGQALWINTTFGCGMLMKADTGGIDCVDVSSCPPECF